MAFPPFAWPPVPTPIIPQNVYEAPTSIGQFAFADIAPATPTQLVDAPPPGLIRLVTTIVVRNIDAVLTLGFTMSDGQGLANCGAALAAGAQASMSPFVPIVLHQLSGPLLCTIDGAGAHAQVTGTYWDLPQPSDFAFGALVLTNAFQPAGFVLPVGTKIALPIFAASVPPAFTLTTLYVVNNDSAVTTIVFRITRSGVPYTINSQLNIAARSRTQVLIPLLPLLSTDLFEIRTNLAPVIAGNIVVRLAYESFSQI